MGGSGCYKLFLLDNHLIWTSALSRSVWFPLNNRTFQRQNIADCANISQEISVTISGLNTAWPWLWILMTGWCDNIRRCHSTAQQSRRYANTWCLFICFYLCRITRYKIWNHLLAGIPRHWDFLLRILKCSVETEVISEDWRLSDGLTQIYQNLQFPG